MQACQKLYEAGYITYMRTDSRVYSAEFIKNSVLFIKDKYGAPFVLENIQTLSSYMCSDLKCIISIFVLNIYIIKYPYHLMFGVAHLECSPYVFHFRFFIAMLCT